MESEDSAISPFTEQRPSLVSYIRRRIDPAGCFQIKFPEFLKPVIFFSSISETPISSRQSSHSSFDQKTDIYQRTFV